jgi:ABC-type multidrug transport system fused ATPase/permease subunit
MLILAQSEMQVLLTLRELTATLPLTVVLGTVSVAAGKAADLVMVLADGIVAEVGAFADLVERRGALFDLTHSHLHLAHRLSDEADELPTPTTT